MNVLLYSGGLDSWLIDKLARPEKKLYIKLKSQYASAEIDRLSSDVEIVCFQETILSRFFFGPFRNGFFVWQAVQRYHPDVVFLGGASGDRPVDTTKAFASLMEFFLNYNGSNTQVMIPFKSYTKSMLLKKYIDSGGDIMEAFWSTFSCYSPINGLECWECDACVRKWAAFALNGYNHKCQARKVLQRKIIPQIKSGIYFRGILEESDLLKASIL